MPSFRSIGARDDYVAIVPLAAHLNQPRVAAHLAILDELAANLRLQVQLGCLAAVWTVDRERIRHGGDGLVSQSPAPDER